MRIDCFAVACANSAPPVSMQTIMVITIFFIGLIVFYYSYDNEMITFEVIANTYRKALYFSVPLITIYVTDIVPTLSHSLIKTTI